ATCTRPESGNSKPAIMRSEVVLPQPEGPSREKNSPAAMSSVTSSTATTRPSKVLVTLARRMVAEVIQPPPEAVAQRPSRRVARAPRLRPILRDAALRAAPQGEDFLNRSSFQKLHHPRVDVLLAGVVPLPVGLDQGGDLGLSGEQLGIVLGVELYLL